MNALLKVQALSKTFGETEVLKDINFKIQPSEYVSIIGPSGTGKTTLLKILAGILPPDFGEVRYSSAMADSRPILVFQDYQLFPHMNLAKNIAFGLEARHASRKERDQKVGEMLEYFGLTHRRHAFPSQLSGGEKQRTALARALILKPKLLLLDEPLANLDRNLKSGTAEFLSQMQREMDISIVSVTHDQEEALMVSDRIGILLNGELREFGCVEDVYFRPSSLETAQFLGPVNRLPGKSTTTGTEYSRAESLNLELCPNGPGRILSRRFMGRFTKYRLEFHGDIIEVFSQNDGLNTNDRVQVHQNHTLSFPSQIK